MPLYPLVGAYFRPPAKAILECLPAGTPLTLLREPENTHDPNAIQVIVHTADIPQSQHETLGFLAAQYGYELNDVLEQSGWHLGYIARQDAATLAPFMGPQDYQATLAFGGDGKPLVNFTLPEGKPA